ncbi:MAG: alpha-2-macroglobulin family protein [Proteobacteria bacterium]|nr:alpha-2-macroglobulin family protein [Pseudomonadota bacterium]
MMIFGIILLIGLSGFGLVYYLNQPRPVRLRVQVGEITPTSLKKDAKPDILLIGFSGSAAPLDMVGKTIESGIDMSPRLEGEWKWLNARHLAFTIKGDWPIDQHISIRFKEGLFPDHIHLERDEVELATPKFRLSIKDHEFYQNPQLQSEKKIVATVRFSHPVDPNSFKERILLEYGKNTKNKEWKHYNKKLDFDVSYDDFFGEAYIHSENIDLPFFEENVKLVVNDGVKSSVAGSNASIEEASYAAVPGMYSFFRVSQAEPTFVRNEQYEPEQVLVVDTTTRVAQEELANHLELFLLPRDRPETPGREAVKSYRGWSRSEIGKLILERSRKVNMESIPADHRYSKLQSFKYAVEPGRFLYLRIKKGARSFGGYILTKEFDQVFEVREFPKELFVMQKGSLLSLSGEKRISIAARGMEDIRYKVGRLLPGQLAHLVTQTVGDLSTVHFSNWNLNEKNITEIFTEFELLPSTGRGKTQYSSFDFSQYMRKTGQPRGVFLFEVQGWDKARERTTGKADKRLVMVTDLGIIVKTSVDRTSNVFVQSIRTGLPVAGCKISVIGSNGTTVLSRSTDSRGKASFPDLKDFKHEKNPVAFLASMGNDFSFIPIKSHVNEVDYSQFDTGGIRTRHQPKTLNAYLFSDRGIYRPGEEVNIGIIVKASKWSRNLKGIPVEVVVSDPRGLRIKNDRIALSELGFEEYRFSTRETSVTGTYDVSLFLLREDGRYRYKLGSRTVKVEEFLPDRLRITARFSVPTNTGWISPDNLKGLVNLQNLFGTPAQERRITGEMILTPSYPSFRQHRAYIFYDPMRSKESYSQVLTEQISDADGNASFDLELNKYEQATYLLKFYSQGFEAKGGRSVSASSSVLVSPLKYLIGYKAEGSLNYISKDSELNLDFIAVNSELEKTEANGLFLESAEVKRVSTLVRQDNGTYKYESIEKEYPIGRSKFAIVSAGTNYRLPTEKSGDFLIVLKDEADVELNRVRYSVMGSTNIAHDKEKNAELQVKLNKTDYSPREKIRIGIRAPYTGSGLITIERDLVYAHKWFKTDKTSTVQTISVPAGLEGNAYVNVTFVRAAKSSEIFMNSMSTGVAPFSISKANRINSISLAVPDLVQPGRSMEIRYKTKHRGKIVVFAVDEGILQVADYRTPDPLNHFFKKKALEVSTRQILDLILPEYSIIRKKILEPGGGAAALLGKNLNPFKRKRDKAVVYWSGILISSAKEETLNVGIPDYFNGKLRVVAVAVSEGAIDAVSDKVTVRGPFVLSPNVPTFVSPTDTFTVSVGVSNNVKGSGKDAKIKLELNTGRHFEILGNKIKTVKTSENSETSVTFDLKANDLLGNGEIRFIASYQNERIQRTATASVRPATPYRTDIKAGYLSAGSDREIQVSRAMFEEFRRNEVGVSFVPLGLSGGLLHYLKSYPYGCTEQLVSRSIPLLVLRERPEFGISSTETKSRLDGTIQILRNRQNHAGGISVWDNSGSMSAFHTAYAMHFLTEVRERDIGVPRQLFLKGLRYLNSYVEIEPENLSDARLKAYAIYILTRNSRITTKALASLKKWLDTYYKVRQNEDVTTLYLAASYKLLKMDREAVDLARSFTRGKSIEVDYHRYLYDRLIRDATYLYLISRHFPELIGDIDDKVIVDLVEPLLKNKYNSISSAYSIMAFDAYAEVSGAPNPENFMVSESNATGLDNQLNLTGGLFSKSNFSELSENLNIENESGQLLFYSAVQSGFDKTAASSPINRKIEVIREYTDADGNVVDEVKQGDEITAHLKFRSISGRRHHNVVIVDLLPGGFEIVLDSLDREAGLDNLDAREDRVLIFTSFGTDLSETRYRIKATNKGTYLLPPVLAKSMYDTQVQSRSVGGEITVK